MLPIQLRILIAVPLLILVWGYSNSVGTTAAITEAFGLPKLDYFSLPGIKRQFDLKKDEVLQTKQELEERLKGAKKGTTAEVLNTLDVKGRAPKTGYSRARFASAWLDTDRNGCDTRNDILNLYLTSKTHKPGTRKCVVLAGVLKDPYTATTIQFERGSGNSIDIDHVVALGDAWVSGAHKWDIKKRAAIANDPYNLLPVSPSANRQKGDGDAATWLPSNKPFRCDYVSRQIGVKAKYDLAVTRAEKQAMIRVLDTCPGHKLVPDTTRLPTVAPNSVKDPGPPK